MRQQMAATGSSPRRIHAAAMPAVSAAMPVVREGGVSIMSGKVITASVT